jgi:hypothetical protein
VIPERVLSAVSTGEVPSFGDVSSFEEARQLMDLMESPAEAVLAIVLSTETEGRPLSNHLIEQLLDSDPSACMGIIAAVSGLLAKSDWNRMQQLALLAIRHASATIRLENLIPLFRRCVAAGLAREALMLFMAAGLTERWAPLFEALRATAEDNASRLDSLAPEMRTIARALHERLHEPAPPPSHTAPAVTPRKTPLAHRPAARRAFPKQSVPNRGRRAGQRRSREKPS